MLWLWFCVDVPLSNTQKEGYIKLSQIILKYNFVSGTSIVPRWHLVSSWNLNCLTFIPHSTFLSTIIGTTIWLGHWDPWMMAELVENELMMDPQVVGWMEVIRWKQMVGWSNSDGWKWGCHILSDLHHLSVRVLSKCKRYPSRLGWYNTPPPTLNNDCPQSVPAGERLWWMGWWQMKPNGWWDLLSLKKKKTDVKPSTDLNKPSPETKTIWTNQQKNEVLTNLCPPRILTGQ